MRRLTRLSPRALMFLSGAAYVAAVPLLQRAGNGYFTIMSLLPVITISLLYGTGRGLQSAAVFTSVNFGLVWIVEDSLTSMTAAGGLMGTLSLFGVAGLVGYLHDLSSRRLRQVVEEKDRLIGTISHELRTPLTTVLGMSHELAANIEGYEPDEIKEFCSLIAQQSGELEALIEDLLVAARADIERIRVMKSPVDLVEVVAVAIEATTESWESQPLVAASTNGQSPIALADDLRVRQVVRNLLQNAHRYGGPDVQIAVGCDRGTCVVSVSDDGNGIPPELVEDIFDPHVRAHTSIGNAESLGLGLYVSQTLARLMNGRIDYRRTEGRTHFDFVLPPAH